MLTPDPSNHTLFESLSGVDQDRSMVALPVINETPLTIFLNAREIVTVMTIGDYPKDLAVGYLLNQNLLKPTDIITAIEHDQTIETVVVRTQTETDYEQKLQKMTITSGCALGTAFGDLMERFDDIRLPEAAELRTSWLYALLKRINALPSLYRVTGALHGCVLCEQDRPLIYMEDVGRHNAVDKIAGYMACHAISPVGRSFYTTGRLTSEMIIKTVQMGLPILISRSGFTAWGVQLARRAGLTLIGRARGRRFVVLSGEQRVVFDADPATIHDEARS